jgi:hypothetical protein
MTWVARSSVNASSPAAPGTTSGQLAANQFATPQTLYERNSNKPVTEIAGVMETMIADQQAFDEAKTRSARDDALRDPSGYNMRGAEIANVIERPRADQQALDEGSGRFVLGDTRNPPRYDFKSS